MSPGRKRERRLPRRTAVSRRSNSPTPAPPLVGAARPPKPALAPNAARAPQEPQGGPALDLKWHADNQHIDNPYLPPWVPNGQGYNVQAGVKLGF